ncbi:MAG TPA: DUF2130 domain-containing protein [Acidobacteriaceae bacterium]|nr:DUF2130 domain-containing protein [Acidobacteriaceae bacterium]
MQKAMMQGPAEQTMQCPQCGYEMKVTESLAAPLIAAVERKYQQQIREQQAAIDGREREVASRSAELDKQAADAERRVSEQVRIRLEAERKQLTAQEAERAQRQVAAELDRQAGELKDREARLESLTGKLKAAQEQEADFLRQKRALEDERRELKLQVERQVQQELEAVRRQAKSQAEEQMGLQVRDKDEAIQVLRRQIDELKRKAEQGSQQAQGEVLEVQAEQQLRARFPMDEIQPVAKGQFGGDLLHTVRDGAGQPCGTILWEFKRTQNWSPGWLAKLRGDQRTAGAEVAVLATQTLPRDITLFDQLEGVWVSSLACTLPVAVALRQALIELARVRRAGEGEETKAQQVYSYLTGAQFRHRVETIAEKFTDMRADLDQERKFMERLWAKREKQLELVLKASEGINGDLQAIAGRTLDAIDALQPQMKLLPDENL